MKVSKVEWTDTAKAELKSVYYYHSEYSEQAASKFINEIIDKAESIVFTQQYQVDEINSSYRRIVVRDYKVLYTENKGTVSIVDIVNTRQSPEKLKKK